MLNHTENETEPVPAAQTRIKTEELARAVAAIEARRQGEAQALVGTLVIGEAVEELSLDMTPEEILAEVRSQQEEHDRQQEDQDKQQEDEQAWKEVGSRYESAGYTPNWKVPAWILAGSLISVFAIWWGTANQTQPISSTVYSPPVVTQNYPMVTPIPQPYMNIQTLAAIPDGINFGCYRYTLERIISGEKPTGILISESEKAFWYDGQHRNHIVSADPLPTTSYGGPDWTAIKYSGHVYVRGWTSRPLSATGDISVFDTPKASLLKGKASKITLPVQGLHYEGMYTRVFPNPYGWQAPVMGAYSGQGYHGEPGMPPIPTPQMEIRASDVRLDSHAWEKW